MRESKKKLQQNQKTAPCGRRQKVRARKAGGYHGRERGAGSERLRVCGSPPADLSPHTGDDGTGLYKEMGTSLQSCSVCISITVLNHF